MKKLTELYAERADKIKSLETLTAGELTDEIRGQFDTLESEVGVLNADIERAEKQEKLNKLTVEIRAEKETVADSTPELGEKYVDALRSFFTTGVAPEEFRGPKGGLEIRADLLTTNDAGLINKTVQNGLTIAKTPVLLDKLPVKRMTNMNGQFELTSMVQITAAFAAETVAVADASAAPVTPVTLSPRRLGAYEVVSREFLNSTNPGIWADILGDLNDAYDRRVSSDAITQFFADTIDASTTQANAAAFANKDLTDLQANINYEDVAYPVYITTPSIASSLANMATIASVSGPAWTGNLFEGTIQGIPAYSNSSVPANHIALFDATKLATAEFGTREILYNPYEYDVEGKVKVTVSGMVDSGFGNYRFASWIADVSIA